ncbi:hypothetical protein ACFYS8_13315 [Kitasatospora sp. NPDC004615]|uniref:hypothetical protein n=1 Tax=Kitasatospora sp. NPDC004615 TaxID=3364017 RepID=UPI00369507DF
MAIEQTDAALAVVQAELDAARAERDQYCDRVDTLTAVCRSNKQAHRITVGEVDRLTAELAACDADTARLREAHAALALQAGHYERRWESTVAEARRQARRADAAEHQLSTDNHLRRNAEANYTIAVSLRAKADDVLALHRPVTRGAMTICDACSPKRGDGPSRHVLVAYPCPTAAVLNAPFLPTT